MRTRCGRTLGGSPIARLARGAVRAALALAILGFVPGLLDPFNAPKAAALRVIGLGLLAMVIVEALVSAARGATSLAASEPRAVGSRARAAMDIAVIAWVLVTIAATLASASPRLSLIGEIEQREGLLTTLALAGLYAGVRRSHHDPAVVRRTLGFIFACVAIAAAYAMIQFAGLDPLAWANAPTYPSGAASTLRPFATLGNPILLGAVLSAALAAGVARLASGKGDVWRVAPFVVLLTVAIVATLSRGAWLAGAAGVAAALMGTLASGAPRAPRRVAVAFAVVAAPAALWGAFALRAPLIARFSEGAHAEAVSSPARAEIARGALALWRAHPWLGTGPDTFGLLFPSVQSAALWRTEWLGVPAHAHSAALQILATCGALGALAGLAWLAAFTGALKTAWRAKGETRADALAVGAAFMALAVAGAINPVGIAGATVFVVLSALAVGGVAKEGGKIAETRRASLAAVVAGVAIAAALAPGSVREMTALASAGRARDALTQATTARPEERAALLDRSVREATAATTVAPAEDELWRLACDASLALAESDLSGRESAAADSAARSADRAARRAMGLEPLRASNFQRLGNALAMRARVERSNGTAVAGGILLGTATAAFADLSDSAFGEARRRASSDALILVDQTRAQLALRRAERALVTARRIAELYPEAATGHALQAAALLTLERRDEARVELRRALAARWEDGSDAEHRAAEAWLHRLGRTR